MAKHNSLYNTPPCYPIYICGLVFEWCLKGGSLDQMHKNRIARSRLLYDCIGNSNGFYRCTAREKFRSEMNVTFRICTLASVGDNLRSPDESVERQFLLESAALGFVQLAGHRSVGGIRASLYNAMPCEAVIALVNFMSEFSAKRSSWFYQHQSIEYCFIPSFIIIKLCMSSFHLLSLSRLLKRVQFELISERG